LEHPNLAMSHRAQRWLSFVPHILNQANHGTFRTSPSPQHRHQHWHQQKSPTPHSQHPINTPASPEHITSPQLCISSLQRCNFSPRDQATTGASAPCCCPSWGKSSRVENSSKSARAELRPTGLNLRPTEMKCLQAEMFRSNTHNAYNEQPLSQSNSGYKWHDTNVCCFWCGLAR
jgi:hypothetical protein